VSTVVLSLIQTSTAWHDPARNRAHFSQLIDQVPVEASIILLPEMFTTGFTMQPELVAETMTGATARWLLDTARQRQQAIGGSVVITEHGRFFNRFLWAMPDGSLHHYDKRHCFRMAGEHEHYASGNTRPVWTAADMRIRPLVCYDLCFPVWLRRRDDYDLLACVANWPAVRLDAWRTLLKARAIENQSYVAGLNILGTDGNGVQYAGGSVVYGPDGQTLLDAEDREGVFCVPLDSDSLAQYRAAFPAWQDADGFKVIDAD
jgi:omega-amidase